MVVTALLVVAWTASARGEGAERSASEPTGADVSTPKKALKTFDRAGTDPHIDRATFFYAAKTDEQKKVAEALASVDLAMAKLRKTAVARFDREAGDRMVHALRDVTADDIEAAKEEINGDKATVSGKGFGEPLGMVKVKGGWKIDVADMIEKTKAKPEAIVDVCDQLVEAIERTEEELSADKYANVSLLERAMKRRVFAILGGE
jgi:hypothetical protein